MTSREQPDLFAFDYPKEPHLRKHGPAGWATYGKYRSWLRDEFSFRCVFCLEREQWQPGRVANPIDHFEPRRLAPEKVSEYDNLFYVCHGCNSIKSDSLVPNPCDLALGDCLRVLDDGTVQALNSDGELLVAELQLDHAKFTEYRRKWIEIIRMAKAQDRALYVKLMGFPDDLPDLRSERPPSNTRADGIEQCFYARRQRGELPEVY